MAKFSDPLEGMQRIMKAMRPAGDFLLPATAMVSAHKSALASIGVSAVVSSMRHAQIAAASTL